MSLPLKPELAAKVEGFLARGRFKDGQEVMREALAALQREGDLAALQYKENVSAIQKGMDDIEAGRCKPWEQIDAEIRAKYKIGNP